MYLLPQISTPSAEILVKELCVLSVSECKSRRRLDHGNRVYSPTGGAFATDAQFKQLCDGLSKIAEGVGYPQGDLAARMRFDVDVAIFLHEKFQITENEAAKQGVWNFLSCVALPDLVRWRFPSDNGTVAVRFLDAEKHTFGRLWWRAKAYFDTNNKDPYWLVREIGEDESCAMMERTSLSGIRPFVVTALRSFIECYKEDKPSIGRQDLLRDAMKRFRRLGGVLALEALSEAELSDLCRSVFKESIGMEKPRMESKVSESVKSVSTKSVAGGGKTGNTSPNSPASSEDLAWLSAEMKGNQGRTRRR